MISITSAQLDTWFALFVFPLSRVLGLMATAPVFNNQGLPARARLIVGLAITLALVPVLPAAPAIPAGSWIGLMIMGQQALIGILLGFALRIAFAAIDFAGELIGLQMSLSFATFFDPGSGGQTPVVSEFLGLLATLIFLALNGHLLALSALAESFVLLPVSAMPIHATALSSVLAWAGTLFSIGLLLSLPLITALLVANIALGVLARIAQQLNLFAVGFPVMLAFGFFVLMLSLSYFGAALESLFMKSFEALHMVVRAAGSPL